MRVLRFILRFLGISAIILWLLSSFIYAQDGDITVNFPDTMEVNGSVEISNLGLNGDPTYNLEDYPTNEQSGMTGTNSGLNGSTVPTTTFINHYESLTLWSGTLSPQNTTTSSSYSDTLYFKYPVFDWTLLKQNFATILYGNHQSAAQAQSQHFFPGILGGRQNLTLYPRQYFTSHITDFVGSGTWSFDVEWKDLGGSWQNSAFSIFSQSGINFSTLLTTILRVLAWYECVYLIYAKVSQG